MASCKANKHSSAAYPVFGGGPHKALGIVFILLPTGVPS